MLRTALPAPRSPSSPPDDDDDGMLEHDEPPSAPPAELGDEASGPTDDPDLVEDVEERGSTDDEESSHLEIGEISTEDDHPPYVDDDRELEHDEEPAFDDRSEHAEAESDEPLEHDDLVHTPPATADDGGAEGTGEAAEGDVDEAALPALDADQHGDFEVGDLLAELGWTGADQPSWQRVAEPSAEGELDAICAAGGLVVAAGRTIALLERSESLVRTRKAPERIVACAITPEVILLATARGVWALRPGASTPELVVDRPGVDELAVAAGRAWARSGTTLLRLELAAGRYEVVRDDVLALAGAGATLFALRGGARAEGVVALRGHDGSWTDSSALGAALAGLAGPTRLVANAGGTLAAVDRGHLLVARPDGAGPTGTLADDVVDVAFFGDAPAAELLVLRATADGAALLRLDAAGGAAEVGSLPGPGPFRAVAWDATRERILVVGAAGLVALGRRVEH